jgi:hypothetical protein
MSEDDNTKVVPFKLVEKEDIPEVTADEVLESGKGLFDKAVVIGYSVESGLNVLFAGLSEQDVYFLLQRAAVDILINDVEDYDE